MKDQSEQFRALGYRVRFTVEPNQPHRLETLAGSGATHLFNQFQEARPGLSAASHPAK